MTITICFLIAVDICVVGCMYQVVDCTAVTAAATADLDALTVGMVCVRILEKTGGRFLGRWSYGHQLWTEYPEIGSCH